MTTIQNKEGIFVQTFIFDDIISKLVDSWVTLAKYGLLALEPFEKAGTQDDIFISLCNVGINGIQNCIDPPVINIFLEVEIAGLAARQTCTDRELQGLFVVRAVINAMRINDYLKLIEYAKCFCTQETFHAFAPYFAYFEEKANM